MKVIIDAEGMRYEHEPLEKGQEAEVDALIGRIWIDTGRAHRKGSEPEKVSSEKEPGKSEETEDVKETDQKKDQKPEGKKAPQSKADKEPENKR